MRRSPPTRRKSLVSAAAAAAAAEASLRDEKMLKASLRSKQHLEGPLRKYTNLLHGWQSRFFELDPDSGRLWYYLSAATRGQQAPRGALSVVGARVCSSPDHPFMFTVQSRAGDVYKLRANDAQDQEIWMTQLQLCSRRTSDCTSKTTSGLTQVKPGLNQD
ncbi:oxysterol-binding protein-related protein 10-like [Eucyclogobius newberryi]|uniref:oxysterol-binding protein-related protein 10-like n=1 Tax=Eucyclogobius newberryi TaxID=166745 RepID=UPI003B5C5BBD